MKDGGGGAGGTLWTRVEGVAGVGGQIPIFYSDLITRGAFPLRMSMMETTLLKIIISTLNLFKTRNV